MVQPKALVGALGVIDLDEGHALRPGGVGPLARQQSHRDVPLDAAPGHVGAAKVVRTCALKICVIACYSDQNRGITYGTCKATAHNFS